MKLVRVQSSYALPRETSPWKESDDKNRRRHFEARDTRGRGHSPAKSRPEDLRKDLRNNGAPFGGSQNAGGFSRTFPPNDQPRIKSQSHWDDSSEGSFAPRISSSRCYPPRDQCRSGQGERARDITKGGFEASSPSQSYGECNKGKVMESGRLGLVGTKRLERDAGLIDPSECKRRSGESSSPSHGSWEVSGCAVKNFCFGKEKEPQKQSLPRRVDQEGRSQGDRERILDRSGGGREGQPSETCAVPEVGDKSEVTETKNQYEMLASLLVDDSLDIEQDFQLPLTPVQEDVEFCGSIFEESIELAGNATDVETFEGIKGKCAKDRVAGSVSETKGIVAVAKKDIVSRTERDWRIESSKSIAGLARDCRLQNSDPNSGTAIANGEDSIARSDIAKVSRENCNSRNCTPVYMKSDDAPKRMQQSRLNDGAPKQEPSRLFVDVTNKFQLHAPSVVKEQVQESDSHRLSQRQRQIDFGKNTLGYERYIELVPRWKRKRPDPQTPDVRQVCSKRSWDGQIRKWRRLLHVYDPPVEKGEEMAEDFSIRLSQRQKQIDYGKATDGYKKYTEVVPRCNRKTSDPQTPDIKQACSKRNWDAQVRQWRRHLHIYDPPTDSEEDDEETCEDFFHQRQMQITSIKNAPGYKRYIGLVPRSTRTSSDPQTPDVRQDCSKSRWNGQLRTWRRLLQLHDPSSESEKDEDDFSKAGRARAGAGGWESDEEAEFDNTSTALNRASIGDSGMSIYEDWTEP